MSYPTLSIIISVYNGTNYIAKNLDTYKNLYFNNKIEIIIINDGSTDTTSSILNQITSNITNVKVYNKKNGGLSSSRNYGINKSSGKFLWFCDGDDEITNSETLLIFLNQMKNIDENIIHFKAKGVNYINKKHSIYWDPKLKNNSVYSIDNYKTIALDTTPWSKFFNKKVFQNIMWPNVWGEDTMLLPYVLSKYKIRYSNNVFYVHIISTPSSLSRKVMLSTKNQMLKKNEVIQFQGDNKYFNNKIEAFQISKLFYLTTHMHLLSRSEYKSFKKIFKKYKNHTLYKWLFQKNIISMTAYYMLRVHMFWLFKHIYFNMQKQ